jgi:hypothetical protein
VSDRRIAVTCAVALFATTVTAAFAGADTPPPRGFGVLAAALAVLSVLVYFRLRVHLGALAEGASVRAWRIAVEGTAGGLAFALFPVLLSSGEPSIRVGAVDLLLWFSVCGMVGTAGALAVWAVALWLRRRQAA